MQAAAGVLSGIITFAGFIPYIYDILKGQTKPERWSYAIWSILGVIYVVGLLAEGATWTLGIAIATLLGPLSVLVLSFKYGVGGFDRIHKISLFFIVVAFGAWALTSSALAAILIALFIDSIAIFLTLKKLIKLPGTELFIAWFAATIGGILAMISVGEWSRLLIFPAYITVVTTIIWVEVLRGKRSLAEQSKTK